MDDIIVLDIETTGLDLKKCSIIEIAAVRLKNGRVVDEFKTLIKPDYSHQLSATVSVLTGIKPDDFIDAPAIETIKDQLLEFVGDKPILGHNIGFDLDFLKANGINLPGLKLDTLELAHTILPKLRFYSLEFLSYYYKFDHKPSHRAMDDVLATVRLYDLLLFHINNLSQPIKEKINLLVGKSNWDWEFIFKNDIASVNQYQAIDRAIDMLEPVNFDINKLIDINFVKSGFNVSELPPQVNQLSANISLVQSYPASILVVSNSVFNSLDWNSLGLIPQYSANLLLDKNRFQFILSKPQLDVLELKLMIKILINTGGEVKRFNPSQFYLTKDEFYLFEQKLAPGKFEKFQLPPKTVISFSTFWELIQNNNLPEDRIIFIPQWLEFDDFILDRQIKTITPAYLNAVVSSRRDFVHDFVTDNKTADQLFKILNELGTNLVITIALLGLVWQDHQKAGENIELEKSFFATQNGVSLKENLDGVIKILSDYKDSIINLDLKQPIILERQLTHTQDLIEYFNLLLNPNKAYKIYIDVFNEVILLRILKDAPFNVWQSNLNNKKIAIVSNGVLVNGNNSFISSILDQQIDVKSIPSKPAGKMKDIIWVRGLPSPKTIAYQEHIDGYLKNWIRQELDKSLVIFPNALAVDNFFDKYQPLLNFNIISRSTAGNIEMLHSKLESKSNFVFLLNYYNLNRFLPAISNLDRLVFIKLPFEHPGKTSQLLAIDKFDNGFIDYALPKAIINFKVALGSVYTKTDEVWMLDSRLLEYDYGKIVRKSITGFKEVEVPSE